MIIVTGCFSCFEGLAVSAKPNPRRIIRINARGRQFDTSCQTLSKTDSPVLQDAIARAAFQSPVDLNVDPQVFGHVLNFLRDGAGFMLPKNPHELLALLELAGDLSMPELVAVIFDHPAAWSQSTTTNERPMNTGRSGKHFAGQTITDCSHCSLGNKAEWETSSTFSDDASESEFSDCSEESVGGSSKVSGSVAKAALFISPDEVLRYSHRSKDELLTLDDIEEKPVRRQWAPGNCRV